MFPHSIRWRLNLWLGFLLICALTGFGVTLYQLQRTNQFRQIDQELERRLAALSAAARGGPGGDSGPGRGPRGGPPKRPDFEEGPGAPPDRGGPGGPRGGARELRLSPQTAGLFNEAATNDFYFAFWTTDGSLARQSANAPVGVTLPAPLARDTRTHTRMRGDFREAFHFTERGECVLAGRTMRADFAALDRFTLWLFAAGGIALTFALGVGWGLTTRALKPVEEISAAASRISAGNLSERITVADTENELGQLAGVLNSTFARLDAAFAQQMRFTADASHELRTPLAVIISETQTTLARERSAAEYRETVETCLDAAQQMRRLAHSLLELARFDAGQETLKRTRVDLAEITHGCADLVRPLARERAIEIHCELAPVEILGDADKINQVITNLLANAIQYNKERGKIRISTFVENCGAVLTVTDTGVGIGPDDLPSVFKRFYRGDKSRARADGRSGLGLAICQAIVEAHGGNMEVASQPGTGTTFTVRLPTGRADLKAATPPANAASTARS